MPINQMRPGGRPRSKVHELVIGKLLAYGDQAVRIGTHQLWCNVDYLKVAVLDALDEVDCKYLVHTQAVDSLMEGNRVTGVLVATKQGLARIRAGVVVDCTGDADVAYFSGAETMKEVGSLSPTTLCLSLANVSREQLRKVNIRAIASKAREKYPLIPNGWGLGRVSNCHHFYINHAGTRDLGQFDATDPLQRTRAECSSRSRRFDDVVAWRSGFLDIGFVRLSRMKIHDVPYRAVLPEKIDGLLVAGRCISATHVAASAGKSMGNCVATGHAAGLAAALSVKARCLPRELRVSALQEALRADDVDLTRGGDSQKELINEG
jgi:hypothetical protein